MSGGNSKEMKAILTFANAAFRVVHDFFWHLRSPRFIAHSVRLLPEHYGQGVTPSIVDEQNAGRWVPPMTPPPALWPDGARERLGDYRHG